ncbi:uncharacterized protein [Dendrobates tinctorius]|uniref:uncharacterized protein isoform X2 n=2 Tax=Dendrobates tinctorius TaxID=92724 RepID=UPI003CCA24BE
MSPPMVHGSHHAGRQVLSNHPCRFAAVTSMPMTCAAYGCKNHYVKGCGKQFFRFPMKDPCRLAKWVLAIRRKHWNPCASSRICSDHFTENDYMIRPGAKVPRLRLDAVPSVFDGFRDHLKKRLERKKRMKKKTDEQIIDDRQGSQDAVQSEKDKIQTCAVHGCNNTCYEGCQQAFFRFPTNDPKLLSKWLVAMHQQNCTSFASRSLCSDHFTETDYSLCPGSSVPQLAPDAVPSLLIALPREIPSALEPRDAQQADPTENNQLEDNITVPSKILETRLHEISNKESLSVKRQKVKRGPVERSRTVACAVHGCNSIFVKGCERRFFRFPMKRPEHLSKWVKAVKRCDWKPSAASRICSDHFKGKDYIILPGILVPRLSLRAVPSVFKARKCRGKPVTATHQNFGDCRSMKVVDGFQETEKHSACDHSYSAFHSEESLPRFTPDTMKLKKKVRTLQRQIQRQRHTIKRLSKTIEQLKSNIVQHHQN